MDTERGLHVRIGTVTAGLLAYGHARQIPGHSVVAVTRCLPFFSLPARRHQFPREASAELTAIFVLCSASRDRSFRRIGAVSNLFRFDIDLWVGALLDGEFHSQVFVDFAAQRPDVPDVALRHDSKSTGMQRSLLLNQVA